MEHGEIVGQLALSKCVLVVAVAGAIEDWAAYVGVVPGIDHEEEKHKVMANGTKLMKHIACAIFPTLDPKAYRLDSPSRKLGG